MKRCSVLFANFALLLLAIGGCGGPQLSDAEIGKPIFTLPVLPGGDEPYPMPELEQPADAPAAAGEEKAGDVNKLRATEH